MLPENYKPKKSVGIVSIILLSAFLIYVATLFLEKERALSSGAKYTIGYTTEKYVTTKGFSIRYRYDVDGVEYTGSTRHTYNSKVPDGRYWLKFSIKKPSISKIYQDKPVPSTVQSIPPNGFDFMMK